LPCETQRQRTLCSSAIVKIGGTQWCSTAVFFLSIISKRPSNGKILHSVCRLKMGSMLLTMDFTLECRGLRSVGFLPVVIYTQAGEISWRVVTHVCTHKVLRLSFFFSFF